MQKNEETRWSFKPKLAVTNWSLNWFIFKLIVVIVFLKLVFIVSQVDVQNKKGQLEASTVCGRVEFGTAAESEPDFAFLCRSAI